VRVRRSGVFVCERLHIRETSRWDSGLSRDVFVVEHCRVREPLESTDAENISFFFIVSFTNERLIFLTGALNAVCTSGRRLGVVGGCKNRIVTAFRHVPHKYCLLMRLS